MDSFSSILYFNVSVYVFVYCALFYFNESFLHGSFIHLVHLVLSMSCHIYNQY